MSALVLKIIAIVTMSIDHIGYIIFNGNISYFNYIGRIAFPIFAFQISEGYIHTKNLKKYFLKLFLFALISQIPFMLYRKAITDDFGLNVMCTLLLGLIAIFIYDNCKYKLLGIITGIAIGVIAQFSKCDYGFYGISIILLFYIFKDSFMKASFFFIIATSIKYGITMFKYGMQPRILFLFIGTCISIVLLALYNGKKGKSIKYFFYLFYPTHLLLLYGINSLIH